MALLAEIRTTIETFREQSRTRLMAVQDAWKSGRRNYWQGIATPATIPDDGGSLVADYSIRPTDQVERWADVFVGPNLLPASVPCQMVIDVYDGEAGQGWSFTVRFTKNARCYRRTWNVGPEIHRSTGWVEESGVIP